MDNVVEDVLQVKIDRNRWLRGEGTHTSLLRRASDGKMCCLGFLCGALGVKNDVITGIGNLYCVKSGIVRNWLAKRAGWRTEHANLVKINDDAYDMDRREVRLIELGRKYEVEFVP